MDHPDSTDMATADEEPAETPFTASFAVGLPAGWGAKSSIEIAEPSGRANLLVSNEPVEPSMDSARYAELHGTLLKAQLPGYRELGLEPCTCFDGRAGYLRRYTWKPKNGLPITQVQAYFAGRGRGITATATAKSAAFSTFEPEFKRLLVELLIDR